MKFAQLRSYEHDGYVANSYADPGTTYYCGETSTFNVVMQIVSNSSGATKAKRMMNWKLI